MWFTVQFMCVIRSFLVLRVGCWIGLYKFLIIAYLLLIKELFKNIVVMATALETEKHFVFFFSCRFYVCTLVHSTEIG